LRIIAAIEWLLDHVCERHLLRLHEISQSHLVGFETGLPRDCIHDGFDRQAHAAAGDPAIRKDRALVGGHGGGAAAVQLEIVGSRQQARHLRGFERGRDRIHGVCASVDVGDAVER
jgi:hypothetical protein